MQHSLADDLKRRTFSVILFNILYETVFYIMFALLWITMERSNHDVGRMFLGCWLELSLHNVLYVTSKRCQNMLDAHGCVNGVVSGCFIPQEHLKRPFSQSNFNQNLLSGMSGSSVSSLLPVRSPHELNAPISSAISLTNTAPLWPTGATVSYSQTGKKGEEKC